MEPITIYLAGMLATSLMAANSDIAAGTAGAVSVSPAASALAWPASLPLAAAYGAGEILKPAMPAKRDLAALNLSNSGQNVRCAYKQIPVSEIVAAGGYQPYATSIQALQLIDSDFVSTTGLFTSSVNWRSGALVEDPRGLIPSVQTDWVGNSINSQGEDVAELRVCSLKPAK